MGLSIRSGTAYFSSGAAATCTTPYDAPTGYGSVVNKRSAHLVAAALDRIGAVGGQLRLCSRRGLGQVLGERRAIQLTARTRDVRHACGYAVHPLGRRSGRMLERLRDCHVGERCFILGNGPSLTQLDLKRLKGETTFGLNRGYLLFDELGFETTYHVCVNRLVAEQFAAELAAVSSVKLFAWKTHQHFVSPTGIAFVRTMERPHFSTEPAKGVWEGSTVTYVALQLAFFMGFTEVILIGVDHEFAIKGPANQVITSTAGDASHFDPEYFGAGVRWQLPDLERSEMAYRLARDHFDRAGRRVLDGTLGGKLRVFEKIEYDGLFC